MMMEIGIRRRRRVGRSSHLLSATIAGCTEDGFDERNAQESTASDSSALTETTRTALSLLSLCSRAARSEQRLLSAAAVAGKSRQLAAGCRATAAASGERRGSESKVVIPN